MLHYALRVFFPRRLLAGVALAGTLTASSPAVFAQALKRPESLRVNQQLNMPVTSDYFVSPTRFILNLAPGESQTVEIQVTNRSGTIQDFKLTTEDFSANPEDGSPIFYDPEYSAPYTARLWIKPEADRFEIAHGEVAFVRATVSVPANAEPGDHQTAIMTTRVNPPGGGGIGVTARMATLFIISVQGDVVQEGEVDSVSPERFLNWTTPVSLYVKVNNRGTVHMEPVGNVEIRNIFGVTVDEIPFSDWIVLRESSREKKLDWNPRFALGRYTARTDFTAFGGLQLASVQGAFWVVPLLPTLIAILAIFIVSFLVQYFFSRFEIRSKNDERMTPPESAPNKKKA